MLLILDACRNDPEAGKGDSDTPMTDVFARGTQLRLPEGRKGEAWATLFSCKVGERAYEEPTKGMGIFTFHLVQGLKGGAADRDGIVDLGDLAPYVAENVADWAAEQPSRRQTPWPASGSS